MAAPALRELQALFWRALEGSVEPALASAVISTPPLAGSDRIGIYAGMYFWRLRDVLGEDFEKTAAVLGDGFAEVVRGYLLAHPSTHPSVRHLGRHFAGFLASTLPPDAPRWLPDLARLEWARVDVFDAPDAEVLTRHDLQALDPADWPGRPLRPVPALQVLESAWPLDRVWRDGGDPPPSPTALRVWRQDGAVYHCAMDATEHGALAKLLAGASFAEICEAFEHLDPANAPAEAGALLARWIDDGLIAGLD